MSAASASSLGGGGRGGSDGGSVAAPPVATGMSASSASSIEGMAFSAAAPSATLSTDGIDRSDNRPLPSSSVVIEV